MNTIQSFGSVCLLLLCSSTALADTVAPFYGDAADSAITVESDGTDFIIVGSSGMDELAIADDGDGNLYLNDETNDVNWMLEGATSVTVYLGGGADLISAAFASVPVELDGEGGADIIYGGSGDDTLYGSGGGDWIEGGGGEDIIYGGGGRDELYGQADNDIIRVQQKRDALDPDICRSRCLQQRIHAGHHVLQTRRKARRDVSTLAPLQCVAAGVPIVAFLNEGSAGARNWWSRVPPNAVEIRISTADSIERLLDSVIWSHDRSPPIVLPQPGVQKTRKSILYATKFLDSV